MGDALSHLDARGQARMVDVGSKPLSAREATALGAVRMRPETLQKIAAGAHAKGDVLTVARIAGIQGAKRCAELIPLCHPLSLSTVEVELAPAATGDSLEIRATCRLEGRTGVEMEALTAVSVAALAVYDMCKSADRDMTIGDIRLLEKKGGRSGHWRAGDA